MPSGFLFCFLRDNYFFFSELVTPSDATNQLYPREQELSNCLAQGNLPRALFLALHLEQPQRLLRILKDFATDAKAPELTTALSDLSDAHLVPLSHSIHKCPTN